MKRAFAIALTGVGLIAVLGLLAGTGFAGQSASSAQYNPSQTAGPAQDSVYGGGRFAGGGTCSDGTPPFCPPTSREFSVNAHASPAGGGAYGTILYGVPEGGATIVRGEVTCLAVAGNRAVVGGVLTSGAFPGNPIMIYFQDLGTAGSTTRDRVSPLFILNPGVDPIPTRFPNECSPLDNNAFGTGYFQLTAGDVVVHDE